MGWKVITPVSTEVVSLAEAQAHLRVPLTGSPPSHPEDAQIEAMISAAREQAEKFTGRAIGAQTIEYALDGFPGSFRLPVDPVTSITSVKYVDTDGVEQTIEASNYALDDYQRPAWLLPAYDYQWPTPRAVANSVKVRFVAGWTPSSVPVAIKQAVLLIVGHLFQNREQLIVGTIATEMPWGAERLLTPYRIDFGM